MKKRLNFWSSALSVLTKWRCDSESSLARRIARGGEGVESEPPPGGRGGGQGMLLRHFFSVL